MPRYVNNGAVGFTTEALAFIRDGITSITNASVILEPSGTGSVTTDKLLNPSSGLASTSTITGSVVVTGGIGVTENLIIGSISPTTINGHNIGSISPAFANLATFTSNSTATFEAISETVATKTGATGVVVHDYSESSIWHHSTISGNFTANITNVPTTDNRSIAVNLILIQGATPYYASALQINGVAQTILWSGYTAPTPQANRFEVQSFLLTRVAGTWAVHGSLSSFG